MKKCEGCGGLLSAGGQSSGGVGTIEAQAFISLLPLLSETIAAVREAAARAAANPVTLEVTRLPSRDTTIRYRLGTHNLPDGYRFHKHSTFDYRNEYQTQKIPVWADFTHPTIHELINDCIECLRAAGIAAIIVAVATDSPQAALSTFGPIWRACMYSKIGERANEIDLQFGSDPMEYGCWTFHSPC